MKLNSHVNRHKYFHRKSQYFEVWPCQLLKYRITFCKKFFLLCFPLSFPLPFFSIPFSTLSPANISDKLDASAQGQDKSACRWCFSFRHGTKSLEMLEWWLEILENVVTFWNSIFNSFFKGSVGIWDLDSLSLVHVSLWVSIVVEEEVISWKLLAAGERHAQVPASLPLVCLPSQPLSWLLSWAKGTCLYTS